MTSVCPSGHTSTADDYCDVCGMPIDTDDGAVESATDSSPAAEQTGDPSGESQCPNCGQANTPGALFCEACGYDFTTGTMPRSTDPSSDSAAEPPGDADSAAPANQPSDHPGNSSGETGPGTFEWVAEVWIDPSWYEAQETPDPLPSPGPPTAVPLTGRSVLVGRRSTSRNIHPDIDCDFDTGVSRRQAQLTTDGHRWWVEDLDSANGTFVGPASGRLPEDPIPTGVKHELAADDRIYIGAWTRIVIREATETEKASLT